MKISSKHLVPYTEERWSKYFQYVVPTPQKKITANTMLCKNTKAMVPLPNVDSDLFDIVAGILKGDTLASYLLMIYLDSVQRTSIDEKNVLALKTARSKWYTTETIKNTDDADDLELLTNKHTLVKSLLYIQLQAAGGIGLYINSDKTVFMCFKQDGAISTLNGRPLKLVNQFTYLGSHILSTKDDVIILKG